IASVRVSLTGSGDSEGLYEDTTLTTQKEDILNVLAYVKGLDIADTNNLFLCGKSQGGLGSALAAVDCEEDINALCLWFPAFCIPDDFRGGRVMFTEFDLNDIPEKVEIFENYAVGKAMIEENLAMDPYALVSPFAKDVLIIHGDSDGIVNYSYSEKLNETYANSELVTIEGGDHGFGGDNELYALDQTVKFIQAHLAE
ncbi:MAG: alpha/beta hydrolase, partial [Blautia sp.]|nr:alpha/beta hydrolase [Blautia sp.]